VVDPPLRALSHPPAPGAITPTHPKPAGQASFRGDAPFPRGEGLLCPHSFHSFLVSAVWFPSTARIEGAHSDRAASASKEGNQTARSSFHPARCASTEGSSSRHVGYLYPGSRCMGRLRSDGLFHSLFVLDDDGRILARGWNRQTFLFEKR